MTKVISLRGCRSAVKPTPTTRHELDAIQLHAQAENAVSMALYYLRQPAVNVPGAARKTVQALALLSRLEKANEAATTNGGRV